MIDPPITVATIRKNSRENLRVSLTTFKNIDLVDLRVTVHLAGTTSVHSPTAKGVSVRVELLPELAEAVLAAKAEAERLGLI